MNDLKRLEFILMLFDELLSLDEPISTADEEPDDDGKWPPKRLDEWIEFNSVP